MVWSLANFATCVHTYILDVLPDELSVKINQEQHLTLTHQSPTTYTLPDLICIVSPKIHDLRLPEIRHLPNPYTTR